MFLGEKKVFKDVDAMCDALEEMVLMSGAFRGEFTIEVTRIDGYNTFMARLV